MGIKLDKVVHSTQFEGFRNYQSPTGAISVPVVSLGSGSTVNYSTSIPYTRAGTVATIYVENATNKYLANAGTRAAGAVYQFTSTETASILVNYYSDTIDVVLSIFNGTGGSINLIAQTITATTAQYDAPITAI